MMSFLYALPPDAAVLIFALGLALIAFELNRPGAVLPGAFGLLLALLAAASLLHHGPVPIALALLVAASAVLLLQLRVRLSLWIALVATLAFIAGLFYLLRFPGQPPVHLATALGCGAFLGAGTTMLTRIAHAARQNKGLD